MTAPNPVIEEAKMKALVERLMARAATLDNAGDGLGYYSAGDASLDRKAASALAALTRERDEAERRIERLHAALIFWMPSVSEEIERELDGRAGDDAYLLAGFMGKLPEQSWGDKVLTRAEAAEARATAAEEDAARLDWLDAVNLRTNERNGNVYGWRYDINHNRAALSDHNLPALTIREAIDSARFPDKATEISMRSLKEGARLKAFDERFPGVRDIARSSLQDQKP